MIALWLATLAPASAGPALVSGGFSAMPQASQVIVPSWRIGVRAGRVTPWFSFMWASLNGGENADVEAWGVVPRLGARLDFGNLAKPVVAFSGLSLSTVVGRAVAEDTEPENNPFDFDGGTPPINVALGFGLDAKVHEALSISAELGGNYSTATVSGDDEIDRAGAFVTYGAVHLNIWLGRTKDAAPQ